MKVFLFIFTLAIIPAIGGATFAQSKVTGADIREVILETGDGFCSDCERIITLSADGTATYHGGKNSRVRKGDFSGQIGADVFAQLAKTMIKADFFELEPLYKGTTSDVAAVKITIVYAGGRKTVENFGRSDEPHLKTITEAVTSVTGKIEWRSGKTEKERFPEFDQFNYRGAIIKNHL